jgi:hypothetical protein
LFDDEIGTSIVQIGHADVNDDGLAELIFTSQKLPEEGSAGLGRARILKPYRPIQVDIRPGANPNVLYFPAGILVVRVLGARIAKDENDAATIRVGGVAPSNYVQQDFDGDGVADVQAYFETARMNVTPDTRRLALTARTRGGLLLGGADQRGSPSKPRQSSSCPAEERKSQGPMTIPCAKQENSGESTTDNS